MRKRRNYQKFITSKPPPKTFNINDYITKSILFIVLLIFFALALTVQMLKKDNVRSEVNATATHSEEITKVQLEYVTVHIDLKGAPPKMDYLIYLLPDLKDLGVNSLLLEYEDMFPYDGMLLNISTPSCYTKNELSMFLLTAAKLGIEVFPLLNFLGNMEYVLKLEEFQYYRESPVDPRIFCSSSNYITVVAEILKQVIEFHQAVAPIKYIHVGCKDVNFQISCPFCVLQKKSTIFAEHMKLVSNHVTSLIPNAKILFWDDVLRNMNSINAIPELNTLVLSDMLKFEPVVWDPNHKFSGRKKHTNFHEMLQLYRRSFGNIWISPAFKGVDKPRGQEAMLPNLKKRLLNTLNWLNFIQDYKFPNETATNFHFKGIVLSGWSREDHFAPINELLPASLQTLTCSLRLIEKFRKGQHKIHVNKFTLKDWNRVYKIYFEDIHEEVESCHILSPIKQTISPVCRINTRLTYDLYKTLKFYEYVLIHSKKMTSKNLNIMDRFEYCDLHALEDFRENELKLVNETLNHCEQKLRGYMEDFFDKSSIDEYIGYRSFKVRTYLLKSMPILSSMFTKRFFRRGRHFPSTIEDFMSSIGHENYKKFHKIM